MSIPETSRASATKSLLASPCRVVQPLQAAKIQVSLVSPQARSSSGSSVACKTNPLAFQRSGELPVLIQTGGSTVPHNTHPKGMAVVNGIFLAMIQTMATSRSEKNLLDLRQTAIPTIPKAVHGWDFLGRFLQRPPAKTALEIAIRSLKSQKKNQCLL